MKSGKGEATEPLSIAVQTGIQPEEKKPSMMDSVKEKVREVSKEMEFARPYTTDRSGPSHPRPVQDIAVSEKHVLFSSMGMNSQWQSDRP